jgi:hypothetical protein
MEHKYSLVYSQKPAIGFMEVFMFETDSDTVNGFTV